MMQSKQTQNEKVIHYFTVIGKDYKRYWLGPEDLAMHFGYYDETTRSHQESLLRMNQVLSEYARITAQDRVLDAGCGYGGSALWLAKHIGCHITGITLLPEQVREARETAAKQSLDQKLRFETMDFTQTTFASDSFDVVWTLESQVHTEQKREFLSEAFRLLRPGGRLILAEYTLREDPPLSLAEYASLTPWLRGWAMASILSAGDYISMLSQQGFHAIQVKNITDHVRPSINKLGKTGLPTLPTASIFLLVIRVLYALRLYSRERVRNIEAGVCQNKALRRGLWQYSIIVAEKPSL